MNIRKDDLVVVTTGDDADLARGRRVLRVLHDEGKVVVEKVNQVVKHVKPSRRNAQGGRIVKEMPINLSNVMLFCPTCRKGVRVGRRYDPADGRKYRYCKKCGNSLGALSKPRKAYAGKRS